MAVVGSNVGRRWLADRLLVALNAVAGLALAYLLLRPTGLVGSGIHAWIANRETRAKIAREWDTLARGERLDAGGSSVLLVEFADYQCPFCKLANDTLEYFLAKHPEVGIVYHHLPLPIHPLATDAAAAAICSAAQGQFRAFHHRLFTSSGWQTDPNWVREAAAVGVPNLANFRSCLSAASTVRRIAVDQAMSASLGILGTPTFLSRTARRDGVLSQAELSDLLGLR